MKVIALALYFAAALSFTMAAEKLEVLKWIHIINPHITAIIPEQNLESQSTCDPQIFTSCMLTFFGHFGMSNTTLPSYFEFWLKYVDIFGIPTPQKFQELCRYMTEISNCAPSSDCLTIDSMSQLNFPDGMEEASFILSYLVPSQSMCKDLNLVLENWGCLFANRDDSNCTMVDNDNATCADAKAFLTCDGNYWSEVCNNDVAKVHCHSYFAAWKAYNSNPCNSSEFDNFCDEGDSTTGGSTAAGSTIAPNSTTPNAGSLNASFCSIVVSIITALAITSLKHA